MLLLSIFLVWFGFKTLDIYTNHGESITVPDLRKFNLEQVEKHLQSKDLRYTIIDSTYVKDKPANVIIAQNPRPGSKVKENRRIYLTINAKTAPIVKLPNIMYASLRNAEIQLKSLGLEVGDLEHIPDLAKNAVLGIKYKGKSVEPGMDVPKGSAIGLVLGDGLGNTRIPIPDLVGLTYHEAKLALSALSLNVGTVLKDPKVWSEDNALVYEQRPAPSPDGGGKMIAIGEPIDLLLRSPKHEPVYDHTKLIEATKPKPPPEPEEGLEEGEELPSSSPQGFVPTPPRPLGDEPSNEAEAEPELVKDEVEDEPEVVETAATPPPSRPAPPPRPVVPPPKPKPKPKPKPVVETPPAPKEPVVVAPPPRPIPPPPAPKPAPPPPPPEVEEKPVVIVPKKKPTPPPPPPPTPPKPRPVEDLIVQPKEVAPPPPPPPAPPKPKPLPKAEEKPLVITPKKKAKPIIKSDDVAIPKPKDTTDPSKSTWKKTRIIKSKPADGGE